MDIEKEEYLNLKLTRKEADKLRDCISEMVEVLQKTVFKDREPPEIVEEFIEDLT